MVVRYIAETEKERFIRKEVESMLLEQEIKTIEQEAQLAIKHLRKIEEIAENKDNNVAFLASVRISDIEKIVKCANIKLT